MKISLYVCVHNNILKTLHFQSSEFSKSLSAKFAKILNPVKPGGIIFTRGKFKFKLFLNDLWDEPQTLWLFLTFTRDYFAEKNWKKYQIFRGNIFLYWRYFQKWEFTYVGIVLVAEINMYMYKKLLVLHHLILSKDYAADFADQPL